MGIKLKGYDEVSIGGQYAKLPAGGYVCRIVEAEVVESRCNGRAQLQVYVDIAEGEYSGHFRRKYEDRREKEGSAHWSNDAVMTRYISDEASGRVTKALKILLESVAGSNSDYRVDANNFEAQELVGKMCGFVFGEREYEVGGRIYTTAEVRFALTADRVRAGDYKVPGVKELTKEITPDYESVPF